MLYLANLLKKRKNLKNYILNFYAFFGFICLLMKIDDL